MSCMGLVTDVDDENAPIVLLVDNNPMSRRRIEQSLRTKEFIFINCRFIPFNIWCRINN